MDFRVFQIFPAAPELKSNMFVNLFDTRVDFLIGHTFPSNVIGGDAAGCHADQHRVKRAKLLEEPGFGRNSL